MIRRGQPTAVALAGAVNIYCVVWEAAAFVFLRGTWCDFFVMVRIRVPVGSKELRVIVVVRVRIPGSE